LAAACLCWPANPLHAHENPSAPCAEKNAGSLAGVVKDQTGAVVSGVKIEALQLASGVKRTRATDNQGRFVFHELPAGRYQITAIASAFEIAMVKDISVTACNETTVNIVLKVAPARAVVEVLSRELGAAVPRRVDAGERAGSRNTAELTGNTPGVSLRENGQLASVPVLHGLGDERAKLVVDGMTVSSACSNHMNPPLSTVASSQAAAVSVMAGITPVSLGGDSLGGTVVVDSQTHGDRDAELGNAGNELARAVERVDHPNAAPFQASVIVYAFFGEPALAIAQQFLAEDSVERTVGFGDGIVSDLVFRLNRAGRKTAEN
jgi:hypothetical protein